MGTDIVIYISFACIEGTNINAACGYTASKWRTESSIDVRYGGTKMHSASIKITMLHIDNIEHCNDKICLLIQKALQSILVTASQFGGYAGFLLYIFAN